MKGVYFIQYTCYTFMEAVKQYKMTVSIQYRAKIVCIIIASELLVHEMVQCKGINKGG